MFNDNYLSLDKKAIKSAWTQDTMRAYLETKGFQFRADYSDYRSVGNRAVVIYPDGHGVSYTDDLPKVFDCFKIVSHLEGYPETDEGFMQTLRYAADFANIPHPAPEQAVCAAEVDAEQKDKEILSIKERWFSIWQDALESDAPRSILDKRNIPTVVLSTCAAHLGWCECASVIYNGRQKKIEKSFIFWSKDYKSLKAMKFNLHTGKRVRDDYSTQTFGSGFRFDPSGLNGEEFFVESEMDALALASAGVRGVAYKTPRTQEVCYLLYDADKQGAEYTETALRNCPAAFDARVYITLKGAQVNDLGDWLNGQTPKKRVVSLQRLVDKVKREAELKRLSAEEQETHNRLSEYWQEKSACYKSNLASMRIAIASKAFIECELGYDTFAGDVKIKDVGGEWRELIDNDITSIRVRLIKKGFSSAKKEDVRDLIEKVAREDNTFDYMCDYLDEHVPAWDGVDRISTFFKDYCKSEEDGQWLKAVAEYLFSALYGRATCTSAGGIKADITPVLISPQGYKKSTLVRILALEDKFFTEVKSLAKDDDVIRAIKQRVAVELAEMAGIRNREYNDVKAFMTKLADTYTPKFKERAETFTRRCLFIMTTNESNCIPDNDAGSVGRRWACVRVGRIDEDALRRDILQLWAQARELFSANGIMWQGVSELNFAGNADHFDVDDWESLIGDWLNKNNFHAIRNTATVWEGVFDKKAGDMKKSDGTRIGVLLRKLGWDIKQTRLTARHIEAGNGITNVLLEKRAKIWVNQNTEPMPTEPMLEINPDSEEFY